MTSRRLPRLWMVGCILLALPILLSACAPARDRAALPLEIVFTRDLLLEQVTDRVTVGAGASIWRADPRSGTPDIVRVTPEEAASSLMPSWSPDRQRIVFASNRGYDLADDPTPPLDIWVCDRDGRNLRRLTNAGHNWTPAFSPDGKRIAFASTRGRQGDEVRLFDLWVMNADGSGQRRIHAGIDLDEDPVFSRNSRTIYFTSVTMQDGRRVSGIWHIPVDGSRAAQPLHDALGRPVLGEDPSLSPDGGTLFYWRGGRLRGFHLVNKTESTHSADALEPWIGPDGRRFVYHRIERDGQRIIASDVFVSFLDGREPRQITTTRDAFFARWAAP